MVLSPSLTDMWSDLTTVQFEEIHFLWLEIAFGEWEETKTGCKYSTFQLGVLAVVLVELTPTHCKGTRSAMPPISHRLPVHCMFIEILPKEDLLVVLSIGKYTNENTGL